MNREVEGSERMSVAKKRVVLVGDSSCGKSALAFKLTENAFLDVYEPTGFDEFQTEVRTSKGQCNLTIMDTSGCHDNSAIRALTYKSCDAIVVCFDLCMQTSLANVEKFWIPELKRSCPNVPVYLAGCKRDAMCEKVCSCDNDCCLQSEEELLGIIQRIGAVAYTECSAKVKDDGVEGLLQAVLDTSSSKKGNGAKRMISKIKKQSKSVQKRLSMVLTSK